MSMYVYGEKRKGVNTEPKVYQHLQNKPISK